MKIGVKCQWPLHLIIKIEIKEKEEEESNKRIANNQRLTTTTTMTEPE